MELARFSVSMDAALLEQFDELIREVGQASRSDAIRDLVRGRLIEADVGDERRHALGVLTLVYDHHRSELQERLTALQHDHLEVIVTTTHVHIDHHHCLEVLLMKGRAGRLRRLAAQIGALPGVEHSQLMLTGTLRKEQQ